MRNYRNWALAVLAVLLFIYLYNPTLKESISIGVNETPFQVKVFDEIAYSQALLRYPINETNCKLVEGVKPNYHVCIYNEGIDVIISASIRQGQIWEIPVLRKLDQMLEYYGTSNAIFLDVGANIGAHSLYFANKGYRTWSVEPQVMNLVKVYHASLLDGSRSRLTLINNALDRKRQQLFIYQDFINVGGSVAHKQDNKRKTTQPIDSVLLSDIFDQILMSVNWFQSRPLNIVMKMDIETYECKAFLGSSKIFDSPQIYIPMVIMEWSLVGQNVNGSFHYRETCPKKNLNELLQLLISHGYESYGIGGLKKSPMRGHKWARQQDIVWIHRSAPRIAFEWDHWNSTLT